MSETTLPEAENIKALRDDEAVLAARRVITSGDAIASELPKNCIIVPMQVLDKPEPINRRQTRRSAADGL